MLTALQQVERIARSPRSAVTPDARRIVVGGCRALGFTFKLDAISDCDDKRIRGTSRASEFDMFQRCVLHVLSENQYFPLPVLIKTTEHII